MRGAGGSFAEELRVAMDGRIIDAEEAPQLAEEALVSGRSPLELLFDRGLITAATLVSLRPHTAAAGGAASSTAMTPVASTWPGALAGGTEAAFPPAVRQRYEPVRLLGQGGMGRVFLARDLRLRREIALKFMLGDDPGPDLRLRA